MTATDDCFVAAILQLWLAGLKAINESINPIVAATDDFLLSLQFSNCGSEGRLFVVAAILQLWQRRTTLFCHCNSPIVAASEGRLFVVAANSPIVAASEGRLFVVAANSPIVAAKDDSFLSLQFSNCGS